MRRLVLLAWLAGCYGDKDLEISFDGGGVQSNVASLEDDCLTCPHLADGVTPVTMKVCVHAENRPAHLGATLRLPAGRWIGDPMPSTETLVSLATTPCVTRSFTPPRTPGTLHVTADVAGVLLDTAIGLGIAQPRLVNISAVPAVVGGDATTIAITGKVTTDKGHVASEGTLVTAKVTVTPATASATILPATQLVDATGAITATVTVSPNATGASVTLTAAAALPLDPLSPLSDTYVLALPQAPPP